MKTASLMHFVRSVISTVLKSWPGYTMTGITSAKSAERSTFQQFVSANLWSQSLSKIRGIPPGRELLCSITQWSRIFLAPLARTDKSRQFTGKETLYKV